LDGRRAGTMRGAHAALLAAAVCFASASTQQSGGVDGRTYPESASPQMITTWLQNATTLELVHLHEAYGDRFDEIHVSAFWNRIKHIAGAPRTAGRRELQKYGAQLLPACELTVVLLPRLDARRVATICHTFASAGLRKGLPWSVVWEALPAQAEAKVHLFNAQELANVAWAFATAGYPAPALFEAIALAAAEKVEGATAQNLANLAWAYATARHEAPALFDALAVEALQEGRLAQFSSQAIASTARAFAWAGHAAPGLFDALEVEASARLGEFTEQELSNTAWAFVTAEHAAHSLFEAIATELVEQERLPEFKPQGLASMSRAFALAEHKAPHLFHAFVPEIVAKLGKFNSQELSNTARAFATSGEASAALFEPLAAEAAGRLSTFNAQELANLGWSYATAGFSAPALFEGIATEAIARLAGIAPRFNRFSPQGLANIAWAFATAGYWEEELFEHLAMESWLRLEEFNPQNVANMAWAFAVFGAPSGRVLFGSPKFVERCEELGAEFGREELFQLHQWALWLRERQEAALTSDEAPWAKLPEGLGERCREAFFSREGTPSQLQFNVTKALRLLVSGKVPTKVKREDRCLETGYTIDAVIERGAERVAVEIHGPWHFLGRSAQQLRVNRPSSDAVAVGWASAADEQHEMGGAMLIKQRQLRHFGWKLLNVPYWEWNALSQNVDADTPRRKQEYLRMKLEEKGFIVIPRPPSPKCPVEPPPPPKVAPPPGWVNFFAPSPPPLLSPPSVRPAEWWEEKQQGSPGTGGAWGSGGKGGGGPRPPPASDGGPRPPEGGGGPRMPPKDGPGAPQQGRRLADPAERASIPPEARMFFPVWMLDTPVEPQDGDADGNSGRPAAEAAGAELVAGRAEESLAAWKRGWPAWPSLSEWPAWVDTPPARRPAHAQHAVGLTPPSTASPSALGRLSLASAEWEEEWRGRFDCWVLALPPGLQSQLGSCMGALGLHVGSRLDAAWRGALGLLGRPDGSPALRTRGAAAEPNCEWVNGADATRQLPAFPEFPDFPDNLEFTVPPIPKLVPSWQRLQGLISLERGPTVHVAPQPLSQTHQPPRQASTMWALGVGAFGGAAAAVALVMVMATARNGCRRQGVADGRQQVLATSSTARVLPTV
tara:strand:+ start:526 stop:3900 length:3375 start_codon:yes stop_codon:yes gene_type:complete